MIKILMAVSAAILLFGCSSKNIVKAVSNSNDSKVSLIFETDMGNDIDDALALDMIYKYIEADKVNLLGIMSNKNNPFSAEFIDIMATWYGHAEIPIGIVRSGGNNEVHGGYAQAICELKEDGQPLFERSLTNHESLPAASHLYRELLSQQPDHSVVIVSVGFSTNLAQLLDTKADKHSSLSGRKLVAKKVKMLSVMAGGFEENSGPEYNVVKDIKAAKKVFEEWPTEIVVSPFEVGLKILYPGASILNDFNWGMKHPMVEAYKAYQPMPYDRPTWDLTSLMYVVENGWNYNESASGKITVDDRGYTHFEEDIKGKHIYLNVTEQQAEEIKTYFVDLIKQKPLKYSNE